MAHKAPKGQIKKERPMKPKNRTGSTKRKATVSKSKSGSRRGY